MPIGYNVDDFGISAPGRAIRVANIHATNNLTDGPCRALWVNDSGAVTVAVLAAGDEDPVTWSIVGPGLLPVHALAVRDTGTASNVLAIY